MFDITDYNSMHLTKQIAQIEAWAEASFDFASLFLVFESHNSMPFCL